ncbi:hypothetical protein GE253_00995 [Niveispirillum sp. SYP-B3756]|uniref:hypothetical protein n=1 Tax=Niveispirillum sp. SYP-B3756 TaxID=2662178 RepID=UPI0012929946|nr:hypothetical protein [Niveispirillum sp. SYP-B3756]MQP63912.1 hypothetical protein [Niveispirillum sp. SYP-B3756]
MIDIPADLDHAHVEIAGAKVKRFDTLWSEGGREWRCAYELLGTVRVCAEVPSIVGKNTEIILSNHAMNNALRSYNLTVHGDTVLFAVHVSDQIIHDLEKYYLSKLARAFDLRLHLVCSDAQARLFSPIGLQMSPVLLPI